MLNQKPTAYILLVFTLLFYLLIAYAFPRHETLPLLLCYGALFGLYCWILYRAKEQQLTFWIAAAILLRLSLLFSVPSLSDDFYRFIWDGRLIASGYHPFSHVPSHYVENNIAIAGIEEGLFLKLNSKNYFTVYPPIAQFIFWISAAASTSIYASLVIMKLIVLVCEIGSIILIRKILRHFQLPGVRVLIYALNPLVVLELMGNVHLEAVMIFFLLLSIHFLTKGKFVWSAATLAVSICVKLIPILFLPAMLSFFGFKKGTLFVFGVGFACLILFLPLISFDIVRGYENSLGYYFSRFEFNASIYYVVRALGFLSFGYNIIQPAGWLLGVVACILILFISNPGSTIHRSWLFKNVMNNFKPANNMLLSIYLMTGSLLIYFLFTTTLHPWYIITLLVLSIFTDFKFVILWTGVIFLTYAGYHRDGFAENLWITAFEYAMVLGYLAYELRRRKNQQLVIA